MKRHAVAFVSTAALIAMPVAAQAHHHKKHHHAKKDTGSSSDTAKPSDKVQGPPNANGADQK